MPESFFSAMLIRLSEYPNLLENCEVRRGVYVELETRVSKVSQISWEMMDPELEFADPT